MAVPTCITLMVALFQSIRFVRYIPLPNKNCVSVHVTVQTFRSGNYSAILCHCHDKDDCNDIARFNPVEAPEQARKIGLALEEKHNANIRCKITDQEGERKCTRRTFEAIGSCYLKSEGVYVFFFNNFI